jgi:hypothetical protein
VRLHQRNDYDFSIKLNNIRLNQLSKSAEEFSTLWTHFSDLSRRALRGGRGNAPTRSLAWLKSKDAGFAPSPLQPFSNASFGRILQSDVSPSEGGEKVTLHPGDTFYEDPAGIHLVGKNASDTKAAKFLAFLVTDKGAPILIPVNE